MTRWRWMRLGMVQMLICVAMVLPSAAQQTADGDWRQVLQRELPLLGHRNWILIVDSAYPLQVSPGLEVVETGGELVPVLRETLQALDASRHVRPNVFQDAELKELPEADAPGIGKFRTQVADLLSEAHLDNKPATLSHAALLAKVAETAKDYRVLVLKTNETLPYTSVFLQLDCKYWSDADERRLRSAEESGTLKNAH